MLVRTQILIDENQKIELEELALQTGESMSKIIREAIFKGLKIQEKKLSKKKKKKLTGAEFMLQQAKKAVEGPGNSEYDKYAYDF